MSVIAHVRYVWACAPLTDMTKQSTHALNELKAFLKQRSASTACDGSENVVYALFLEPHTADVDAPAPSFWNRMLTFAIENMQPSPVMTHVELVVPRSQSPVHFSTYIGMKSGWRRNVANNYQYYIVRHANRWRAVPVIADEAEMRVRSVCDKCKGVSYSIFRYITSAFGIRNFACLVPDGLRCDAHCATLTARVIKSAGVAPYMRPSAYYGPASLYKELVEKIPVSQTSEYTAIQSVEALLDVERILRGSDDVVRGMTESECMQSIQILTQAVCTKQNCDDIDARIRSQKDLANAILRWSCVNRGDFNKV